MTVLTFPSSSRTLGLHPSSGAGAIQKISITGSPTGGTFTLTYSGQTTGAIAYNATAYALEQALRVLSNVGVGQIGVVGSLATGWVIYFMGTLDNTAVTLTSTASLTGGTSPALVITSQQAGHAVRANDASYGFVNLVFGTGARQFVAVPPPPNVWTAQTYSVPGVRNPAPPNGQLWPRGNPTTINWPF